MLMVHNLRLLEVLDLLEAVVLFLVTLLILSLVIRERMMLKFFFEC